MNLYDIHTHDVPESETEEDSKQNSLFILNVYPLGFEYAKDNSNCNWFSCGIHPWYSENAEPQLKFLKEITIDPRIVAIGEAGYDKLKGPNFSMQKYIFEQQVELSEELEKPLIIHCVKAWDQLLASWKNYKPKQPWIIHGYRGKPELTQQLINYGFYFSINNKFNINSIQIIPLDKIFCETDSMEIPISKVYHKVADILQISMQYLSNQIEKNVQNIFNIEMNSNHLPQKIKIEYTNE